MKNLRLLFLFFIAFKSVNAQIEEGNLLIGGDFDMSWAWYGGNDNVFSVNANATSAYMINDYIAFGGGMAYGRSVLKQADYTSSGLSIFPVARLYFANEMPIAFYFDIRPGVTFSSFSTGADEESLTGFLFRGGPGMAVFISESVSVDISLNYYRNTQSFAGDSNRLALNIGFQIFLNASEKG